MLILVVEHLVHGVRRLPAAYGGDFATEYLEHLRRVEFFAIMRSGGEDAWTHAMRALDRVEFPPLLVLLQHPLDLLFGSHPGVSVAANLGWLALAGGATVALAWSLGLRRAAPWAGVLLLLMPGMWGPARAYYYDLPMIALLTVGTAAGVELTRRPRVGLALLVPVAFAGAELVKWEAVLYIGATIPAILLVAMFRDGAARSRVGGVVAFLGGLAAAVGIVAAYVWRHGGAFASRFGQVVSLNQGAGSEAGSDVLLTGPLQRLLHVGEDGWAFYPQWLTSSSLGLVFVLLFVVAAARVHRMPRAAAVGPISAGAGILVALVAVSDIQEVRFIHPALPWAAVFLTAGLAALPGRSAGIALAAAGILGVSQLLAADYVHEAEDSRLRTGIAAPWPLSFLLGGSVTPLPQSPGNQTGWRRPVDHRVNDAFAMRTAIAWIASRTHVGGAEVALHPLNREIGRAQYAWAFWSLHRDEGLELLPSRPMRDCGVDPHDPEGPRDRATYLVVDFDPALLGAGRDPWCDAVGCRADESWEQVDPCGVIPELLGWGAGWTVGPAVPYVSRWGAQLHETRIWVLERGRP
jgi:4-amino-4-deoxy-L-arabinose transferase-like glycosyltransferase